MPPIKKKITLAVPVAKVWAALTAPKAISAWMGGPVKSNPRVGGKFALFGGETTGRYTAVEKPNTLEYTWRQANWPATWPDSHVRWKFRVTKTGTQLTLTHDKFPNQDERDGHDGGGDEYWLGPMQAWLEGK